MTVGKTSLDDCDRLTWSLGWTGALLPSTPPASSIARLAITSLAFMLDCVPLPVCHTTSGKCASRSPAITSAAARSISAATSGASRPSPRLARAHACLTTPNPRMTARGNRCPPMRKFASDRWVWAPQ